MSIGQIIHRTSSDSYPQTENINFCNSRPSLRTTKRTTKKKTTKSKQTPKNKDPGKDEIFGLAKLGNGGSSVLTESGLDSHLKNKWKKE